MLDINLEQISQLISKKVGKDIVIEKIEKFKSGYHSDGFKLLAKDGCNYFLKKIKSNDLGFEFPERKLSSLLVSHSMHRRINLKPQAIGIILANKEFSEMLPDLTESTDIYHLQELSDEGIDYYSLLQQRKNKLKVDNIDIKEITKIVDLITTIHSKKHPSTDSNDLKAVYNDSLRSVLTCPELTMMLLQDFDQHHPLLPLKKQKEYIGLMLDLIHKWKDRSERLVALHGDFWGANLFFNKDGSVWVIDYSRIPWGDRGIDIGWWVSQYLWFYHATNNKYYRELAELFIKKYNNKINDKELLESMSLVLGLMGIINISPRINPNLDILIGKKFIDNIWEILRKGKFVWKD